MKPRLDIHFSLRDQLSFLFGCPYCRKPSEFLLNHARSGILLALQALHLTKGAKVGVMAYNCHTVFNAVSQAGCIPVFIDVTNGLGLDLNDLKKKKQGLSALIVTHLFGIHNDVDAIKEVCPGIPVIEDCAHAYGIPEVKGDIAVFSIGQGKLPSLGDGGILSVRNDVYLDETTRLYESVPDYSVFAEIKQFCKLLLKAVSYLPWVYSCVTLPMKMRKPAFSGREDIIVKRMSRGVSRMYERERHQVLNQIFERRQRAMELIRNSQGPGLSFLCGDNAFMLVARCDTPEVLKTRYKARGIETATHFAHCIDWAKSFGYQDGMCPTAEYLTKHLLMIPTYA